jgi:hypothetical protein
MGLALGVGVLADLIVHDPEGAEWARDSNQQVNEALARDGLARHDEPESFASALQRHSCTSFPYSFLHYLRRAFAHVQEGLAVPDDEALRPEHDGVIEDVAMMMSSHLLCHSDAEGHYVPIDFSEPIFDDDVAGGMLGSSQALLRELLEVAPAIGVILEDSRPTAACEAQLREIEDGAPLWRERLVWYALFEAATISIEHRTLLVFH